MVRSRPFGNGLCDQSIGDEVEGKEKEKKVAQKAGKPTAILKPLPVEEWDRSLDAVAADMGNQPLNVQALLAHHPDLLNAWWHLRMHGVSGGELGQRKGELVILRVAVALKSWYEWASHVERGLAAGLTLEEIDKIKHFSAGDWSREEAALLVAVDELIADFRISEDGYATLREAYTDRQVLDLIAIVGMYLILGSVINTFGLDLDEGVQDRLPETVTRENFES